MHIHFFRQVMLLVGMMFGVAAYGQTVEDDAGFGKINTETVDIGGFKVKSPLRYYDNVQMSASFCVPVAKVKPLLPPSGLELTLVKPDTTVLIMAASEFRRIADMEPYNQFGIFLPVTHKHPNSHGIMGFFAVYLPASSAQAVHVGAAVYGLPKSFAQISFREADGLRHCCVEADGKPIITFTVRKIAAKLQPLETYCYSLKNGHLLSYRLQSRGPWEISNDASGAAFTLGEHPIAKMLLTWQIDPTPISVFYSPQLQMLLYAPSELGQCGESATIFFSPDGKK